MPLRNGLTALAIALPFGQCEASALSALSRVAGGIADFRFAPGRRLLALGPRDACEGLRQSAAVLGFVTDPADPRLRVVACPGSPACASGHFNARRLGARVAAVLPRGFEGMVHVSGCAKGCAHPSPAGYVLAGSPAGIALVRDGRAADTPMTTATGPDAALDLLRGMLDRAAA
jgi:precorrin-3B synthase